MAGFKGLEMRFRKIHPGHSPAPVHKSGGPTTHAHRAEPSPVSTTTVQPKAPTASIAPQSSLGEIKIRAESSVLSSPTTSPAKQLAEAADASTSGDTSCTPDSLGELGTFSRNFSRTSTAKGRRFEFVGSTTYTRAYNRAYELGGLRGTPSAIKPATTGDLTAKKRECSNAGCGIHTKGWTAEKTLFLAKAKLRREEEEIKEKRHLGNLAAVEALREMEEEELRQKGRRDLEALERSFEQGIDGDGADWDWEDEISIVTEARL